MENKIDDDMLYAMLNSCSINVDCSLGSQHDGDCKTYEQVKIAFLEARLDKERSGFIRMEAARDCLKHQKEKMFVHLNGECTCVHPTDCLNKIKEIDCEHEDDRGLDEYEPHYKEIDALKIESNNMKTSCNMLEHAKFREHISRELGHVEELHERALKAESEVKKLREKLIDNCDIETDESLLAELLLVEEKLAAQENLNAINGSIRDQLVSLYKNGKLIETELVSQWLELYTRSYVLDKTWINKII